MSSANPGSGAQTLTRHEVEFAFRLLRGFEPDAAVVDRLLRRKHSLAQLREALLPKGAPANQPQIARGHLLMAGAARIDIDVSPAVLDRLLAHIEGVWREFGENNPYWSVLTNFKLGPDQNMDAFYETGRPRVEMFEAALARAGIDVSLLQTCFELGCGVGRITVWLADHFEHMIAADISTSHIAIAESAIGARGKTNVEFCRVASMSDFERVPPFDAFFSMITLQHNPPPVIKYILTILLRRLRPGGIAYFQIPTLIPNGDFEAEAYLSDLSPHRRMETFALPQQALFKVFDEVGVRVLEIREDNQCGPTVLSNTVLVKKPN